MMKIHSWSDSEMGYSFLRLMSFILSDTDFIVFSAIFKCPTVDASSRIAVNDTYIAEFTHLPLRIVRLSLCNLKKSNFIQCKRTKKDMVYYISENEIVSKIRVFCRIQHGNNTRQHLDTCLTCSCGQTFDIFKYTDIDMKCKNCGKVYNEETDPKLNLMKDLRLLSEEAFASHGPFLKYNYEEIHVLRWPENTPIFFRGNHSSHSHDDDLNSNSHFIQTNTNKSLHSDLKIDSEEMQTSKSKEMYPSSSNVEFEGLISQEELESMSEEDVNEYMHRLMNA